MMAKVFAPILGDCAVVYVDDVLIFSKSIDEHAKHLQRAFNCILSSGETAGECLKLSPSKCYFGYTRLGYLGHLISSEGI